MRKHTGPNRISKCQFTATSALQLLWRSEKCSVESRLQCAMARWTSFCVPFKLQGRAAGQETARGDQHSSWTAQGFRQMGILGTHAWCTFKSMCQGHAMPSWLLHDDRTGVEKPRLALPLEWKRPCSTLSEKVTFAYRLLPSLCAKGEFEYVWVQFVCTRSQPVLNSSSGRVLASHRQPR